MVVQSAAPLFSTSWGLFVQNTACHTRPQRTQNQKARRDLGLRPGDPLDAKVEGERIVLTPKKKRFKKAKIVIDPVSGMLAVTLGPGAPVQIGRACPSQRGHT